ncbi:ergothioneine biosynthesis protein EgtB [Algibacter amylolyticus]|uniref:Ergothioneine biosynthesis protein EgtB n=1 Tax=Algibacter amylolyticus TaxID=1608400 RepID=A0A5M7BI66_9FLAO|nr:ergothioneine biosynthesis protein EgtB [Algibacter amylolyticus]KAA5827927.1 ergothioneine biosynthesis protein EgtB [Algibacter amylolyticus]MBB5267161.1 ergothioneine biosynthesis protein EgtB [Algibacter amylolyticus]TSJ82172.1 ergothioneine biosynthesis protein EgtB [Algibacter amylolyticus]
MNINERYKSVRQQTIDFCSYLQPEDYAIQVVQFASPVKWHLAHTTWFFETFILKTELDGYVEYDSNFNFLFNSYYNNVGSRVLQSNRGNMSRPSTDAIFAYRDYVDKHMLNFFETKLEQNVLDLVVLGLNHEQQHQELLITDVKYMLGNNALFPVFNKDFNLIKDENTAADTVKISADVYKIGHQDNGFCYDNELGVHKVYVPNFEINNFLVTNGDYMAFMEAGGYSDFNLWLDEGWAWLNKEQIKAPMYWHQIDGEWHVYTLAGIQKVDKNAVLSHINFYEANAYAEWKGMRLPTEFEWEVAAQKLDWGKRWEWTSSAYLPYPNFVKENGAVGEYNGKFMSNKMVLRGASVATSQNHSRKTYRNFFHPSERWQFTGIRLVK